MQSSRRNRCLPVLLALCCAPLAAQNLRSGLWEFNTKVDLGAGVSMPDMQTLQAQLASLPAEQRQMVQEMMAKSGMGAGGDPGAFANRICVTPEMAARNQLPVQAEGDCRTESQPRSGTTIRISYRCTNPRSSGQGVITVNSPDSYQLSMDASVQVQGQTQKVKVNGQGRWVGADCGSVRPAN